jgi:di/tricarboxylate transporter
MFIGIEPNQLILFVILLAAVVLLFTEWIRIDLTAVLIILALSLSGVLEPEEALSGFSSEPAILLASVFVLSGAMFHTGLSEQLGNWIKRLAGRSLERAVGVVMPTVAFMSAFTHHVTITALMLPPMLKLSRENDIPASKLLMPLSFAASLGTAITIIGAPAFLIARGLLEQAGARELGVFSIAPIGLTITIAGTLFFLLLGRFLLPSHPNGDEASDHFRLEGYYTELLVLPDSNFIGKTIRQIEQEQPTDFKVSAWYRDEQRRGRPFGSKKTQTGDILVVRTNPDKLATIEKERGIALHPLEKYKESILFLQENGNSREELSSRLIQSVVAPRSDFIGRSIGRIDFLQNYGVIVVGVWRSKRGLRTELSRVKLREGDVLVMAGSDAAFKRISSDSSFLMLVPFKGESKPLHKARLTGIIMLVSTIIAALNVIPVQIAFLGGAAVMILSGCISIQQAYESIDTRIFVFIAGAIPLGLALQKTGTAELMASGLQGVVSNWNIYWILLALFLVTGLATQIMSDAATTALFAPIALALAQGLDLPPEPLVITVAMAAVTSFFTPIGHHGNLLIYGPGRYQFSDFLRVGIPLTLVVAAIVILLAPLLWPG